MVNQSPVSDVPSPSTLVRHEASTRAFFPAAGAEPVRQRLRVLVCAYACSPVRGSEAGIGWNLASRLARWHDVTMLTTPGHHDPHRAEIEARLQRDPIEHFHPVFVENPPLLRLCEWKKNRIGRALYYVGYASWMRRALKVARRLHAEKPFDLTHMITITGFREPSYLWKLPVPFVWGPVAGASNLPWKYFSLLGMRDRMVYGLRNIANETQKRLGLRPRKAARKAAHIFAVGEDSRRMIEDLWGASCTILLENGGAPSPLAAIKTYDPSRNEQEPLRLIWGGYHVGRKAIPLALHAIAALGSRPRVHLTLLGSGPEKSQWQALGRTLGIEDRLTWIDEVPHAEAQRRMSQAHVFIFPSLQEASATVTLEALSLGLPIICNACCGMAVAITPECGFPVPLSTPQGTIAGYAEAIRRLASEPGLVERLSRGALKRSEELSWDNSARIIAETYVKIVQSKQRE